MVQRRKRLRLKRDGRGWKATQIEVRRVAVEGDSIRRLAHRLEHTNRFIDVGTVLSTGEKGSGVKGPALMRCLSSAMARSLASTSAPFAAASELKAWRAVEWIDSSRARSRDVGPDRLCSPRHVFPFNSRTEGLQCG